jgi:hypothetical protein
MRFRRTMRVEAFVVDHRDWDQAHRRVRIRPFAPLSKVTRGPEG